MHMNILIHISLCTICMPSTLQVWKKVSDPLELELWLFMLVVMLGIKPVISGGASSALNC